MKQVASYILTLSIVCGSVHAQEPAGVPSPSRMDQYMETGMEVAGVRAPY